MTPQTCRFRDALSKTPPSTPRHSVMSAGKLFKRASPNAPMTPHTPSTLQTIYHEARQLFVRGADPGCLVGREDERSRLEGFVNRVASPSPSGCLYVSGPPGTGKSAMVTAVSKAVADRHSNVQHAYINCMSIRSSKDLYATLLSILNQDDATTEVGAVATLQKLFTRKKATGPAYLVVLDEIDHILTMGLESLYRMFEWSLTTPSRLTLVGIANALDLTDRFLPRLKSRNLKPELLPFLPYTAPQIKSIIVTRLKTLLPAGSSNSEYVPFIHPAAVELCSRKVSSQTGDLRRAFEVCRRVLDLVEAETMQKYEIEARDQLLQATPSRKPLGETANGASPSKGRVRPTVGQLLVDSFKALTAETAPRASIAHLNRVTSAAFSNGTGQRLKTLNLQQKAALCSLVAFEKRNRAERSPSKVQTPSKGQTLSPTVKKLFDAYSRLCTYDSVLHPLSGSEFREVISSLETLGLVTPVDGKTGDLVFSQTPSKKRRAGFLAANEERRVASCVAEDEIEQAAEGVGAGILKAILHGEELLD
jgi:cell division control protein 6